MNTLYFSKLFQHFQQLDNLFENFFLPKFYFFRGMFKTIVFLNFQWVFFSCPALAFRQLFYSFAFLGLDFRIWTSELGSEADFFVYIPNLGSKMRILATRGQHLQKIPQKCLKLFFIFSIFHFFLPPKG